MIGVTTSKQDHIHTWSHKRMQEDEGFKFNTVECLRGRLLAERQASKIANEEAKSISNKLIELEKKLREEIKLRERAERRLKYLKKKLESFSLLPWESDQTKPNPPISDTYMHKFLQDYDHSQCHSQDLKSDDESRCPEDCI